MVFWPPLLMIGSKPCSGLSPGCDACFCLAAFSPVFGLQHFDSDGWFSLCFSWDSLGFSNLYTCVLYQIWLVLAISLLFCFILYFPSMMPFDIVLQLSEALFIFGLYFCLFFRLRNFY